MKIKKGDTVLIISGKDRGKRGKVLDIFPKEAKLVVENTNFRKKHQKAKKQGEKGQIVELPSPFSISNVELICPKCDKPTRVGHKTIDNKKYRICKKCGQEL
ncbi:MAG: 50S ribosomal protein L24 [Candidatus Nealsonbacteria bacterium]|nr:50S ribosomal protein L24 [Candidatus Nealsonbacteria bacterium]